MSAAIFFPATSRATWIHCSPWKRGQCEVRFRQYLRAGFGCATDATGHSRRIWFAKQRWYLVDDAERTYSARKQPRHCGQPYGVQAAPQAPWYARPAFQLRSIAFTALRTSFSFVHYCLLAVCMGCPGGGSCPVGTNISSVQGVVGPSTPDPLPSCLFVCFRTRELRKCQFPLKFGCPNTHNRLPATRTHFYAPFLLPRACACPSLRMRMQLLGASSACGPLRRFLCPNYHRRLRSTPRGPRTPRTNGHLAPGSLVCHQLPRCVMQCAVYVAL